MRAERVGSETLLAQIVQMVSQAQRSRAPIQRLADRVAAWFVPAVIAIAVLTFVSWSFFGPEPRLAHALVNAVAVLIIACPALWVGDTDGDHGRNRTRRQAGVLIKNAEALEILEKVDTLVVDKTGTLTEGKPAWCLSSPCRDRPRTKCLRLVASVEQGSEHPLGAAIVAAAKDRGLSSVASARFSPVPGMGVSGQVDGKRDSSSVTSDCFRERNFPTS